MGFKSTYKELKPHTIQTRKYCGLSFKSTYKELKPISFFLAPYSISSFKSTYKELKLMVIMKMILNSVVLSLPIRN